jgi:hypothetical protein
VAYELRPPTVLGADDQAFLSMLGLGVSAEIELRPVGLVAAAWDGEGRGEWIAGDHALVAISADYDVVDGVATIDGGAPSRIDWGSPKSRRGFLDLGSLQLGEHVLKVSILPSGSGIAPIDATLTFTIREPRARAADGTLREAMLIRCSPAGPSLEELWEHRANVEIVGPRGLQVIAKLRLEQKQDASLGEYSLKLPPLPIDASTWSEALQELTEGAATNRYDEATSCLVEVTHPALGVARLRCSREFQALRWGVGHDRNGGYARLYDNIGARDLKLERIDFAAPDTRVLVASDPDSKLRHDNGGLLVASWREHRAAVVIHPPVHELGDLRRVLVRPWITSGHRSVDTILRWVDLSELWSSARLPGNAAARIARDIVLRAFAVSVASVIGGRDWAACEHAIATAEAPEQEARAWEASALVVAGNADERTATAEITRLVREGGRQSVDDRSDQFAKHLRRVIPNLRFGFDHAWAARLLLRLASSPAEARAWAGDSCALALQFVLSHPSVLRAARFYVLGVHVQAGGRASRGCYAGWDWE